MNFPQPVRWLLSSLWLVLLPLLGWGQTTIFGPTSTGTPTGWALNNNVPALAIDLNTYYLLEPAATPDNITTASYDLSTYTSATFSLSTASYGGSPFNSAAKVEISYDGGTTYTQTATTTTPTTTTYSSTSVTLTGTLTSTVVIRISNSYLTTQSGHGVRLQSLKLVANAATTTPVLTGSPTTLTGFTYVVGSGPSASQSFNLSGTNLTAGGGNITVTGSTDYNVSATSTGTYGTTATVAYTGTSLAATAVYVQLKAGLTAASYNSEAITAAGGGAASTTVTTASGSVTAPAPVLTVNPTSLSGFSTVAGTASASQSYVLTGTNVTAATTVTAATGFAVSLDNMTFAASVSALAANVNSTAGQTIYVRLTGAAAGSPSGNVGNATTGATTVNVTVSGTVAAAPVLTASATSLTGFTYITGNGPSASQTFNLSGANLTGAPGSLTVTGSTDYEVSADNTTFGSTATIPYSSATLGTTPVYVRLKAGLAVGTYNGETITATGGGATAATVTVSGNVTAMPTLAVTPSSLTGFSTVQGTASAVQTYTLTGTNLTSGVTVTPPAGYQLAQSATTTTTAGTYSAVGVAITVTQGTATAGRTIYVRLAAAAIAGTYTGTITNDATGATTQNVAVSGTVAAPAPVLTASPTSLTGLTYVVGNGPSASKSFSLSGSNLTGFPDNITITGSTNYEVSTDNTTFSNTATVPYTSATLASTTVYVRLKAGLAVATYNSESIGVAGGGTSTSVTASGSVAAAPTVSTTAVNPTSVAAGSTVTVAYTTTGTFGTGNTFSVELSTATGTYPGTTLTTTTSSTGSITATIPASTTPGTGYTVRVNASNPATTGGTPQALTITGAPIATYSTFGLTSSATQVPVASTATNATATAIVRGAGLNGPNSIAANSFGAVVSSTIPTTLATAIAANAYFGFSVAADANYVANISNLAIDSYRTANGLATIELLYSLDGTTFSAANSLGSFALTTTTAVYTFTPSGTLLQNVAGPVYFRLYAYGTGTGSGGGNIYLINQGGTSAGRAVTVNGTITVAVPTITSFTPTSGVVGTTVTINGTNFTNTSTVSFNGTAATTVNFINVGQLTAVVPTGATTGPIAVTTSLGTGTSTTSFLVLIASPAGLLTLEDDFDYPAGDLLTTHSWVEHMSGANPITVASGNQTITQYPVGYGRDVKGSAPLVGSGQDVYKTFTLPMGATTFYASTIINLSVAQSTGDYFFHLLDNTTLAGASPVFRGKVFAQSSGAGYKLGLSLESNASAAQYSTDVYEFGKSYHVVVKYQQNTATGQDDAVSLFVFADPGAPLIEPTPTIGPITEAGLADAPGLNGVALRQGTTGPTLSLDGVRVATGWGAAIGRLVYQTAGNTAAAGSYYSLRVFGTGSQVSTSGQVILEKTLNLDGGQVTTSTANQLLLRDRTPIRANISDGFEVLANGGNSYVDGPVAREAIGSPSLIFPVGRNGNYRPMTLSINLAPAGTTIYTGVQADASAYSADATVITPLTRVSRVRYFSITPNPAPAAGTFTGMVALSFGSDDQVTDPSLASLVIAKSDGAGWNNIDRSSNNSTSVTSALFQDFSNFALASTDPNISNNPLPVSLIAFTATRATSGVQVAWATASEKNSHYFEVQRSLDGSTFASVAKVAAQGTTTQSHTYASLDAPAPATLLYYRLRQVDLDGTVAYSPVVSVAATDGATAEFTLAPNPARERLSFLTALPTAYTVRNTLGQLVRSGTTTAGTNDLLVGELPAGVYFFELHGDAGRLVRKFVKE